MNGVDLNAINAGLLTKLSGLGKRLDDLVDLLLGHFGTGDIGSPAGRLFTGTGQLMAGVDDGLDNSPGDLVLVQYKE